MCELFSVWEGTSFSELHLKNSIACLSAPYPAIMKAMSRRQCVKAWVELSSPLPLSKSCSTQVAHRTDCPQKTLLSSDCCSYSRPRGSRRETRYKLCQIDQQLLLKGPASSASIDQCQYRPVPISCCLSCWATHANGERQASNQSCSGRPCCRRYRNLKF